MSYSISCTSPNGISESALADFDAPSELLCTEQLTATYDPASRAIWARMTPGPRPCFNLDLLHDLSEYCQRLTNTDGDFYVRGEKHPIQCAILASGTPGVFNLGGDLALFIDLIETRNRAGLVRYGRACIDVVYRNYIGHDLPIHTISLIQGECLGGGFEAALSSELIIAERSSRFGFPEILFNLFPGMGACSLLERRIGRQKTDSLLASGKVLSAEEMLEIGAIDSVVDDGMGEAAVHTLLTEERRMSNGLLGLSRSRRRVNGIQLQELSDVVDIWVQHALQLTERDLKLMHRLVARQNSITPGAGLR